VAADANTGACPNGFRAVPQLTERLTFTPPNRNQFAVDSFPGQQHAPITDHADFINVMSDSSCRRRSTASTPAVAAADPATPPPAPARRVPYGPVGRDGESVAGDAPVH